MSDSDRLGGTDRSEVIAGAAERLRSAYRGGVVEPIRRQFENGDIAGAYAVQEANSCLWEREGRRLVGRKIGLTSAAVQAQLGVDQPDFGMLFADMEYAAGDAIPPGAVLQPRAEAEVALIINRRVDDPKITASALAAAVEYVVPAIEIAGSRVANWDIGIVDTIADNASAGAFVLGYERRRLDGLDLELAGMVMTLGGRVVSTGVGAACLGHPMRAALWLTRKVAELGRPLEEGDIILSGALGPMVAAKPGDRFHARIGGLGAVEIQFAEEVDG